MTSNRHEMSESLNLYELFLRYTQTATPPSPYQNDLPIHWLLQHLSKFPPDPSINSLSNDSFRLIHHTHGGIFQLPRILLHDGARIIVLKSAAIEKNTGQLRDADAGEEKIHGC